MNVAGAECSGELLLICKCLYYRFHTKPLAMTAVKKSNANKRSIYVIILVLLVGSIAYRITQGSSFQSTSILFVGLPALLSLLVVKYTGTPQSTYGLVFKVITLFLLISGILLGEGILCIVVAAPIFYSVGLLVALVYDRLMKRGRDKASMVLLAPLLLLIAQPWKLNTPVSSTVSTAVEFEHELSMQEFDASISSLPELPIFFRYGFPKPLSIMGQGLSVGDQRSIDFLSSTRGEGTLVLEIEEVDESEIRFKVVSDDTHMGSWLSWQSITVQLDREASAVVWTSTYTCELGPQWYFVPIERYAVRLMHKYLVELYFGK